MYNTIKEATVAWVQSFNAIPQSVVAKLMQYDNSVYEITPVSAGDRVYITGGEWQGHKGCISDLKLDVEEPFCLIDIDGEPDSYIIDMKYIEADREDILPMWGTMFSPEQIDQDWILGTYCDSHLQEVADCGFRIYESEDFGMLLGIDAAGFDFYEAFWCPLYKTRGLHWHKESDKNNESKGYSRT